MKIRFLTCLGVLILFLGASCAKRGLPSGGPEDTTPPFVAEIEPSGGSIGVALDSPIRIVFSEKMNKRSVESNMAVSPSLSWQKRYWKGLELILIPEKGLSPNTTYIVSISGKARDSHGVAMGNAFCSGFSTGDSLSNGSISGKVFWKKVAVEGAMVVVVESDMAFDESIWEKGSSLVTFTGKGGVYAIPYLDTAKGYRVLALLDDNSNGIYDVGEKIGCSAGVIKFDDGETSSSADITLCEKGLSGTVRGSVSEQVIDTISVVVRLASLEDTASVLHAGLSSDFSFEIQCVKPGRYLLGLFEDANGNRKVDLNERQIFEYPDTVWVEQCCLIQLPNIGDEK